MHLYMSTPTQEQAQSIHTNAAHLCISVMHRDDRAKSRAAYCNLITSTPLGERSAHAQTHTYTHMS